MRPTWCMLFLLAFVLTVDGRGGRGGGRGGGKSSGGGSHSSGSHSSSGHGGRSTSRGSASSGLIHGYTGYWRFPGSSFGSSSQSSNTYSQSNVPANIAGVVLWDLMRTRNHHHHYGTHEVHHHHYQDGNDNNNPITYDQPTYHDKMRERFTIRITPNTTEPGADNIMEVTHYVTDYSGEIYFARGNMTCTSIYNGTSISEWHQRQVKDFEKQYPNSPFPLYQSENDTESESFTVTAGRIIHREPVTITCCGIHNGNEYIRLMMNGERDGMNCVNHVGYIPVRKLIFKRKQHVEAVDTTGWHEIQLRDFTYNASSSSTSVPLSSTESPLPPLPEFPKNVTTSTATPVDLIQMVAPSATKNGTETVDMTQVDSLDSNSTTESTIELINNPQ